MPARKASSTARGLGWDHRRQRDLLLKRLVDGTPCWWCDQPLFAEPLRNWDGRRLAADHTVPRAFGGEKCDRLLHSTCNEQRGDGRRDDKRPALTGKSPWSPDRRATETLVMDW